MNPILQNIARENFRQSGYVSVPRRERRERWSFSRPPRLPAASPGVLRTASLRRAHASARQTERPTILNRMIHALFAR